MAIGLRFMTSKIIERVPVSDWTYDKWCNLYKSMRKTITVDQNNIALTRAAHLGYCRLWRFKKVFTNLHNPYKDYGSNRLFQTYLNGLYGQALSAGFADRHPTRHKLVGEGCIPIPTTCRAWR